MDNFGFEKYNEAQMWDSSRFHNEKYQIVACVGDEHDYSYEPVDYTNSWKEARRYEKMGANVYCGNDLVHFVDHEELDRAFQVVKHLFLDRQSFLWDDGFLDIEDRIDIEEAYKILDKNGIKLNAAWEQKVLERSKRRGGDLLETPLKYRPRYMFKLADLDELPF